MTLSSRFQTGGSQKSKDAIEEHKRLVDRIVLHLDSETLFNRKFIRRLLSDPDVIGKLLNKADQTAGWLFHQVLMLLSILILLISVTASLSQHRCHSIIVTASVSQHHCHSIVVTASLSQHQCHIISVTASVSHHQCHIISVTAHHHYIAYYNYVMKYLSGR